MREAAGGRQLHAHAALPVPRQRRAPRQAIDAVDVEAGLDDHAAHGGQMRGGQRRPEHAHQVAPLALRAHPVVVLLAGDRSEMDLHAELVGLQQQLGQQRRGLHFVGELHQQPERQRVVDDGLADVEDRRARLRENRGQRVRDAGWSWPVMSMRRTRVCGCVGMRKEIIAPSASRRRDHWARPARR